MPSSSVDTFFACSLMVILITSAMVIMTKVEQPYLNSFSNTNESTLYETFAEHLLLTPGEPVDWGKMLYQTPTVFGLASATGEFYSLDIDKVSRLNSDNIHAIVYSDIATGISREIAFNIKVRPVFNVSLSLLSKSRNQANTTYNFQIRTERSGSPITTSLSSYTVVEDHIETAATSTATDGIAFINSTLPDSTNGTAVFIVFARAEITPRLVSFQAISFSHNSEVQENRSFLRFSPLDHVLNATHLSPDVQISNSYVFTYSYHFNLSHMLTGDQSTTYIIPQLVDASPMMLVLNGYSNGTSFTEWDTYPQIPLEIGADLPGLTRKTDSVAFPYLVNINSALYEAIVICGGA